MQTVPQTIPQGPLAQSLTETQSLTFGTLLRALRESRGMTQRALVDAAAVRGAERVSGMVVSALSHWEDGRRVPLPPQLLAILHVLAPDPIAPEFRDDCLALIQLLAPLDARYNQIVSLWSMITDPDQRYTAWETQAGCVQLRAPRGQAWDGPVVPE